MMTTSSGSMSLHEPEKKSPRKNVAPAAVVIPSNDDDQHVAPSTGDAAGPTIEYPKSDSSSSDEDTQLAIIAQRKKIAEKKLAVARQQAAAAQRQAEAARQQAEADGHCGRRNRNGV